MGKELEMNDVRALTTVDNVMRLIREVIEEFTHHPNRLVIRNVQMGRTSKITIQAHRADTPRIVGERGATIRALTTVAKAMAENAGTRIIIELLEPEVGELEQWAKYKPADRWRADWFHSLVKEMAGLAFRGKTEVKLIESGDTTVFEIGLEKKELMIRVNEIGDALNVLFNAIGKANGRTIYVQVFADWADSPK